MTKKTYTKFVATAATATLVASAIAPVAASADSKQFTDVNERYAPAVDYVVSKGVNGKTTTQFGVQDSIKRVDAAVFIANALDLNKPGSPDAGFSDVPARAQDAVNALKEKGIINGKTETRFGANDVLTRGEVALILANAYNLKGDANSVKFTDVNKNRYGAAVAGLVDAGVTQGISETKFGTDNPVKRGDLAVFLYGLSDETPEVPSTDGITSVKAINDTTVEVKFGKEIDKDFIREAERNGKYFVAYKYGDTINGNIIQSTSLSFSADGKTAEFTTGEALQAGERYYVALIDGENAGVANIVHQYGPAEILEAAKAPSFEVSAVADKIYIDFSEKMKSTALKVDKYEVYDNGGQKLGDLVDFVTDLQGASTDEGAWTNATKKNKVEFTLAPTGSTDKKQLRAGETYKIKLKEDLETDSNKKLNKDNTTITVKTPSVKEAAPKAMQARIVETGSDSTEAEVVLVFDKDINLLTTDAQELKHLIQLTYGNKKVNATSIKVDTTHDVANELKLTIEDTEAKDAILDKALTYNVEVPANLVNNAVFPNAANEAIKGIKATAQDNIEIKSLKAQFEADAKVKDQANLILTFDQRPNLESLKIELKTDKFKIKEGTTTYTGTDFNIEDTDVKYYEGDTSGKSIIIEGINSDDFQVFSNKTYTVELDANTVQVDAYDGNGVKNQSKLKATINGVAVTAPVVDKVTLVSEKEIKVEFEEAIDSTIDLNKVKIAGFEADGNKFFSPKILTGKTYLDTSVSGNTLTIKAKKSDAIFETGFSDEALITFEKDAFTTKGTDLSVTALTINEDSEYKLVDNAAPVLAHAVEVDDKNIQFVFTEALSGIGSNETAIAALFRTGGAADKSSIGTTATLESDTSLLKVEFKEAWNTQENPVDLLDVTINYAPGQTTFLKDSKGNKVKATKLNGVKAQ